MYEVGFRQSSLLLLPRMDLPGTETSRAVIRKRK